MLLLGNALLVVPAFWRTLKALKVVLTHISFLWLGLNVWYFYGRWGMVPRTS